MQIGLEANIPKVSHTTRPGGELDVENPSIIRPIEPVDVASPLIGIGEVVVETQANVECTFMRRETHAVGRLTHRVGIEGQRATPGQVCLEVRCVSDQIRGILIRSLGAGSARFGWLRLVELFGGGVDRAIVASQNADRAQGKA